MDSIHSQGLLVAACLIGCAVFALILCIRILPGRIDKLTAYEEVENRSRNRLVLGWVALACACLIAGHLVAYCMLGPTPAQCLTQSIEPRRTETAAQ